MQAYLVQDSTNIKIRATRSMTTSKTVEIYRPRAVSNHGVWQFDSLQIKVHGLVASGKEITASLLSEAQLFIRDEVLPSITSENENNGLGFVIVHPGDFGVSFSVHWWIQGSVLCQQIHRQLYNSKEPMDMVTRPVIACVWELAIINVEQEAWRNAMMAPNPDFKAYLANFGDLKFV